ncbi:MAG: PAS domain-containing protein, partial [Coriobacteriales bacterium]|nr:PAS domain-containing protein [Coriobacteriales bacterium]
MPATPDRESTLSALLDAAEEGMLAIDGSGSVVYANPSAMRLLRWDDTALSRGIDELDGGELAERIHQALAGHVPTGPVLVLVQGHELACRIWRSEEAGVAIGVSLHNDSALVGRRERIEAVLNATQDGLIVLSPVNVVTYVNPAAIEMLNTSAEEMIDRRISVDELLGIEALREAGLEPCWEIMQCGLPDCPAYDAEDRRCWLMSGTLCCGGEPASFAEKMDRCRHCKVYELDAEAFDALAGDDFEEIEIEHNGTRLIANVRVTPVIDAAGDYVGRVLAIRDITHEHEIAQMKNEFVSTVSHELRTPLTSIKGYVDLIVDGDAGEVNEIQLEFLSIVQENSDRLVQLINDMLDISRIESGRIHLKVEPISLRDSIADAVATFQAVLAQSGRTVKADVPDDLPDVAGDRDRVNQVLINFISNAIKYSPEGGDVTVTAKGADGAVMVSVTDQGLGISVEDQKLLFQKFFRVDSAITREIGGTGLGLSICKSIIELLGGSIGVKSKLGEGSTFFFTLPVAAADLVGMPKVAGPVGAHGTVLVVDRDP